MSCIYLYRKRGLFNDRVCVCVCVRERETAAVHLTYHLQVKFILVLQDRKNDWCIFPPSIPKHQGQQLATSHVASCIQRHTLPFNACVVTDSVTYLGRRGQLCGLTALKGSCQETWHASGHCAGDGCLKWWAEGGATLTNKRRADQTSLQPHPDRVGSPPEKVHLS